MFVSNMKILALNTKQSLSLSMPSNTIHQQHKEQTNDINEPNADTCVSVTTSLNDLSTHAHNGGSTQKAQVVVNSIRESHQKFSNSNKNKYNYANSNNNHNHGHKSQQKYHHNSNSNSINNSNNISNSNKNKKQHYNNNNSSTSTSLNRKKFYQHQQNLLQQKNQYHSQQQKYQQQYSQPITSSSVSNNTQEQHVMTTAGLMNIRDESLPTPISLSDINKTLNKSHHINNNNNCSSVKNKNYTNLHHSQSDESIENENVAFDLQMLKGNDQFRLQLKLSNNNNNNSNNRSISNTNTLPPRDGCNVDSCDNIQSYGIVPANNTTCLDSLPKLSPQSKSASLKTNKGTKLHASLNKTNNLQDFVAAAFAHKCRCQMNSTVSVGTTHAPASISRKKNFWKNLNAASGCNGEDAFSSCANCLNLTNSEANDFKVIATTSDVCLPRRHLRNVAELSEGIKTSNEKNFNVQSLSSAELSSENFPKAAKVSTVENAFQCGASFSVKSSDISPMASPDSHEIIQNTITHSDKSNNDVGGTIENIHIDAVTNKAADSASKHVAGRGPLSPNAYSLDFLHSVGVQITGASSSSDTLSKSGSNNRITAGTTVQHGNRIAPSSTQRPTHCYSVITNSRPQHVAIESGHVKNDHRFTQQQQQNHHHPSQLTIASFLQKDLFGDCSGGHMTSNQKSTVSASPNNYNDQRGNIQKQHYNRHHQHPRYFLTSHYQQHPQANSVSRHHGVAGVSGGGNHRYLNYHNDASGSSNLQHYHHITQHHHPHVQYVQYQNKKCEPLPNSSINKKPSHLSSSASSCSSSSTTSNTSINSQQKHQHTVQRQIKSSSHLNSAIETLPSKHLNPRQGHHHRGAGHYFGHNYHGHQNHLGHPHHHTTPNTPTTPQHQNYYNLTYVSTTDGNLLNQNVRSVTTPTSGGCSLVPQVSDTSLSANMHDLENNNIPASMLSGLPQNYSNYLAPQNPKPPQHVQHIQQQNYVGGKKIMVPMTLPSPVSSPTPLTAQQMPLGPHNVICCSQLDEVTTAAAASAAVKTGIVTNEYDSDTSSAHSMSVLTGSEIEKYHKSSQNGQQDCRNQPTTPVDFSSSSAHLYSPLNFTHTTAFGAQSLSSSKGNPLSSQPHHQQPEQQKHQLMTQEQLGYTLIPSNASGTSLPRVYDKSGVISLLNFASHSPERCGASSSNFMHDDRHHQHQHQHQNQQQQQQPQNVYRAAHSQPSGEHLNVVSALSLPKTFNSSASSSGYWSPQSHQSNILYQQISMGSSAMSVSPCLTDQGHDFVLNARSEGSSPSLCINEPADGGYLTSSIGECSSVNSSSSGSSLSGHPGSCNFGSPTVENKTGSTQLLMSQQQRSIAHKQQRPNSSSPVMLNCASSATLSNSYRLRNGVTRNKQQHGLQTAIQPIGSSNVNSIHHQQHQHLYPQQQATLGPNALSHNLFFNSPQAHHLRPLSNSSMPDFCTHTPPDRFLARAHLIEAKETPEYLLNNTKWDNLSQGIWNKFLSSQQTEETFKQKMHLWRYLYLFVKNAYPRYGLYLVGSTISGFGSDTSDVDMCLVSRSASSIDPRMEALFNLTILRDCLGKSGEFEHFNLIEAKVPILRFRDRVHQLEVDLNFNNCVGIKNTHLLYCYSQLDWRLRPLVLVTKLWAQHHDINNAKNMTISSYSFVLMVIHFLQYGVSPPVLPCLHDMFPEKFPLLRSNDFGYVDMNETLGPYESKNDKTIGELFLKFLEYYSCFNYTQNAISVRTGGTLPINVCRVAKSIKNDPHQWKVLCIEEPFDLTNTARSVYDYETFERVKAVFISSWHALQETLDLNSIFASTIGMPISLSSPLHMKSDSDRKENNIEDPAKSDVSCNALMVNNRLPENPVDDNTMLIPKFREANKSQTQFKTNLCEETTSSYISSKHTGRSDNIASALII